MGLSLARALRLAPPRTDGQAAGAIAFAGAGGKTTAMFQLARQLDPPVIACTTTHLAQAQAALADQHVIAAEPGDLPSVYSGVTVVTGPPAPEDKLGPLSPDVLERLRAACTQRGLPLLIEADGARQRALKAPAEHEPAIPAFADVVIVVAALSAVGKPLSEAVVHRADQFGALGGLRLGDTITPEALARVLRSAAGGLKNVPASARRVALLTQASTALLQAKARGLAAALLPSFDAVLIADAAKPGQVQAAMEPAAGIVLAAGGSSRMGRPKVLLDWRGEPFVHAVARTALAAGLNEVVVVVGANAEQVAGAVSGLPVRVVRNPDWQAGQSTSIRLGLQSLSPAAGAAVFLLADQPQIHFDVIRALLDEHAAGLPAIVAPLVMMERRANPVLFDRVTFPQLMALEGDVGGRAVFDKFRVEYLPWHDDRLLLDVDTEADYRRLMEDDTL